MKKELVSNIIEIIFFILGVVLVLKSKTFNMLGAFILGCLASHLYYRILMKGGKQ